MFAFSAMIYLQCFDAVGWASGRASGLQKIDWWGAGMVICLDWGAMFALWSSWCHCHSIVYCIIKIQNGVTFLVLAKPGCPCKEAVKWVCLPVVSSIVSGAECYSASGCVLQSHYAVMVQLAPVVFLLLISLITAFLASEPMYSLRLTQ